MYQNTNQLLYENGPKEDKALIKIQRLPYIS